MDDFGWYYRDDNNQRGPVSGKEIQEFVKTGVIKRYALIWHPSLKDWTPLSETTFKDFLPPTPPIRWFFRQVSDDTEVGPIAEDKFIAIIKNITLPAETPVRQEYSQNWEPLSQSELWAKVSHNIQLPSTEPKETFDREHNDTQETKPCPYCRSPIKALAIYCRHCQRYLNEEKPSKNNKSDSSEVIPTESGTIHISENSETTSTETTKSNLPLEITSSVKELISEISSSDNPIVDFYKKNQKLVLIGGGIIFVIIITLVLFFSFFSEESKVQSAMQTFIRGSNLEITDVYIKGEYACAGVKSKWDSASDTPAGIALSKAGRKWFILTASIKNDNIMTFNSCVRIINQLKQ